MVTRYKQHVDDILLSKSLNLYPAENQAAKIFAKWLSEHPEYSADDVDMRIDSYEREEDYHGNGGGYDRYVRIFKRRKETDAELAARIKDEEDKVFEKFTRDVHAAIGELILNLSVYPNVVSDVITAKINEIESGIIDHTRKCLSDKIGIQW